MELCFACQFRTFPRISYSVLIRANTILPSFSSLLNRLFPLTVSPHLKPSLKTSEAAHDRNVSVFLDHLSGISLPIRHHFFHSDLLADPPTTEGLDRVANTLLEIAKLPSDNPPPISHDLRARSRRGSSSSQNSDSSHTSQSRSPPASPRQTSFFRLQATPPSSPPASVAARARSPTGGRVMPGSPLSTAVEDKVSTVIDGGTLQKVRTLSNSGGRRMTPPSPLGRGVGGGSVSKETLMPGSPTPTLKKRRPASRSSGNGTISSSSRPSLAPDPAPDSSSSSESANSSTRA
jgi:hypothetical protein